MPIDCFFFNVNSVFFTLFFIPKFEFLVVFSGRL